MVNLLIFALWAAEGVAGSLPALPPKPPTVPPVPTAPAVAPAAVPAAPTVAPAGVPPVAPTLVPPATTGGKKPPRKIASRAREKDADGRPIPPALTAGALRREIGQPGADDKAPRSERERMEALAADLTRAREALKAETARLEALLAGKPRPVTTDDGAVAAEPVAPAAPMQPVSLKGQLDIVSKALKGMKPEQAGPIISRLDRVLAAEVLRRMPAGTAGSIMATLKPELAADLATEIATKPQRVPPTAKEAP